MKKSYYVHIGKQLKARARTGNGNGKIHLIKAFRNSTGFGLRSSLDYISEMMDTGNPIQIDRLDVPTIERLLETGFIVTGYTDDHFKEDDGLFEI